MLQKKRVIFNVQRGQQILPKDLWNHSTIRIPMDSFRIPSAKKTMLSHSMICWAKSSAQPTTPAASTGAAGTTYQPFTRHGSLPCMNFRGHPNDITSGVQTWPIPTSRLIGVETFTSPPNLSACCCCIFSYKTSTVVQLTRPRCIDISDALKFTETLKWRAATSPVKHSTSQVVTPRALLQLVSRFCWRNRWTEEVRGEISYVCSMMLQIMSHSRPHSWQRTELSMLRQCWTDHPDLLYWYSIIIVQ